MHTLRDRVFPVLSFGLARLHTRRKQCLDKKALSDGLESAVVMPLDLPVALFLTTKTDFNGPNCSM